MELWNKEGSLVAISLNGRMNTTANVRIGPSGDSACSTRVTVRAIIATVGPLDHLLEMGMLRISYMRIPWRKLREKALSGMG